MLLSELPFRTALDLGEDDRWLAVQRIIDSPLFRKSLRLSQLLLYLSKQTLLDHADHLTEHQIATKVFERQTGFDPGVDTIVRTHMVRLRQKLDQYAEENRFVESMRVAVPKGEYRVRFEKIAEAECKSPLTDLPPATIVSDFAAAAQSKALLRLCWLLGFAVLTLLIVLLVVIRHSGDQIAAPPPATPASHPLWSCFFQPRHTTTFVAADSGLVLLHRMTAQETTLKEYLSRDFSRETNGLSPERMDEVLNMGNRRYTSFVDLNMFRQLEQLPYAASGKLEVKYARDIQMDDLKQGSIILSGSRGANPWIELYETDMNFVGANDAVHHAYSFINRHPQPGETSEFSVTETDPKQRVLGVLAFLSNLDGSGNALIVEGNSMAGTEAISDFVFDDAALLPFLHKVTKPNGTLSHFEVLIESNSVNGSAGPFRVLAYRTHP
jgi:hypothetical protein